MWSSSTSSDGLFSEYQHTSLYIFECCLCVVHSFNLDVSDVEVQPHLWLHILWWVVQWISADLALVETCLTRCTTSNLWSGIYTHFITQYCCSAYGPHCKFMTFSSAWPIALTHICAPPFLSDQMNYVSLQVQCQQQVPHLVKGSLQTLPPTKCGTCCTTKCAMHYTHCYELDVATWPHTDVSCSLYIHCTSYLHVFYTGWWWQTAHSTSLYTAQALYIHCTSSVHVFHYTLHKLCVCMHVFRSHLQSVIFSQVTSCLYWFHLFIRWNSKNEHCTITQHISVIFITEEAPYSWLHAAERRIPSAWQAQESNLKFKKWTLLISQATYFWHVLLWGPNIYGMLVRPDSWKQVDC